MTPQEIVALAAEKRVRWKAYPEEFVREVLRIEQIDRDFVITKQQSEALQAVGKLYTSKYKQYEVDRGRCPTGIGMNPMDEVNKEFSQMLGLSIMAGRGVGKSAFLSWIIIWFLLLFEEARLVCTSTKQEQLKTVIWAGVSQWLHAKLPNGEYAFLFRDLIKVTGEI